MSRVPVAIVGGSGYTGAELLRILLRHPRVEVAAVCARRSAGERLADVFPHLAGVVDRTVEPFDAAEVAARAEVALCALPHGASAPIVAALRERGVAVVDLSADFRLRDPAAYAEWYGPHPHPELIGGAVYGLPERYRDRLRGAALIAAPGCYPTSALLAIAPLLAAGLVRGDDLIVDAKSGASGAGREPGLATHLPEAGEGIRAYKVGGAHRHIPEIEQELAAIAGGAPRIVFTPHLVPMSRGIFTCVYAVPTERDRPEADYRAAVDAAYAAEPFITVLPAGRVPDTAHVRGSNRAHVNVCVDRRAGRVLAMCAIDNLGKGASGQAVQCLNAARGWPETDGLDAPPVFP